MTRNRIARILAVAAGTTLTLGLSAGAAPAWDFPELPELGISFCDLNPDSPICLPDVPEPEVNPEVNPCLGNPDLCDLTTPTTDPTPEPDPDPTDDVVPTAEPSVVVPATPHFTG
jgi:hypothetical protein